MTEKNTKTTAANRAYKSRIFEMIFSDKKELLSLYNAVNGTSYQNPEEFPSLELTATLLNINKGYNKELMEACQTLKDYAEYTARVREYAADGPLDLAVERAVDECIREGILEDFLRKNRAEAIKMSIYEYDEELHMR